MYIYSRSFIAITITCTIPFVKSYQLKRESSRRMIFIVVIYTAFALHDSNIDQFRYRYMAIIKHPSFYKQMKRESENSKFTEKIFSITHCLSYRLPAVFITKCNEDMELIESTLSRSYSSLLKNELVVHNYWDFMYNNYIKYLEDPLETRDIGATVLYFNELVITQLNLNMEIYTLYTTIEMNKQLNEYKKYYPKLFDYIDLNLQGMMSSQPFLLSLLLFIKFKYSIDLMTRVLVETIIYGYMGIHKHFKSIYVNRLIPSEKSISLLNNIQNKMIVLDKYNELIKAT